MLARFVGVPLRTRGFVAGPRAALVARAKGPGGKKKEAVKEKKVFIPPCMHSALPGVSVPFFLASSLFYRCELLSSCSNVLVSVCLIGFADRGRRVALCRICRLVSSLP